MSSTVGLVRLVSSAGSDRSAVSTGPPSVLAPNSITSGRRLQKPLTVAIRPASSARQPASSSAPGGTSSVTVATAARSSERGMIASIASHTCSRRTCSPQSAASNSTSTAAARLEEALASLGWRRTVSLSASRCALPSSSVVISRSNSSKASSIALASSSTTVACSVASRRCGGCRFNRAGLPAMP